jgi:hypothetical protein
LDPKTKWEYFGIEGIVELNKTKTFYTVSASSNLTDNTGVRLLYPASKKGDKSGCAHFPCDDATNTYHKLDLKSIEETDLICEIGGK